MVQNILQRQSIVCILFIEWRTAMHTICIYKYLIQLNTHNIPNNFEYVQICMYCWFPCGRSHSPGRRNIFHMNSRIMNWILVSGYSRNCNDGGSLLLTEHFNNYKTINSKHSKCKCYIFCSSNSHWIRSPFQLHSLHLVNSFPPNSWYQRFSHARKLSYRFSMIFFCHLTSLLS